MYQDPSLRIEAARLHQRELVTRALSRSARPSDDCADVPPSRQVVEIGTLAQRLTAMLTPRARRTKPAC